MKTIVIGGDGAIGQALARSLRSKGHEVAATSRRTAGGAADAWPLDLGGADLDRVPLPQGEVAFFCAAITRFAECRADPVRARQVNVIGPDKIARRLVGQGTRVVLLSTSAVFDWSRPRWPANEPHRPITAYGELKAEAEKRFTVLGPQASILRISKVLTPDYGLIKEWAAALSAGQRITAFSDLQMAPIALEDALASLLTIAISAEGGIYQFSATSDISYHQAALHIAARLGANLDLVAEGRASYAGVPAEEIVRYSSLDASRLTAMNGRQAPDPFDVIDGLMETLASRV